MPGRVMELEATKYAMGLRSRKGFIESSRGVRGQIVHHDANQLGLRVVDIDEVARACGKILRRAPVGELHLASWPLCRRGEERRWPRARVVAICASIDHSLDAIMVLAPTNRDGRRLRKRYGAVRGSLFTFLEQPNVPPDNNGSEQELRPTGRSPAASDRSGVPSYSPTSVPSSAPPRAVAPTPITPFCGAHPCYNRIEQLRHLWARLAHGREIPIMLPMIPVKRGHGTVSCAQFC